MESDLERIADLHAADERASRESDFVLQKQADGARRVHRTIWNEPAVRPRGAPAA
jgi:hypothetical protein